MELKTLAQENTMLLISAKDLQEFGRQLIAEIKRQGAHTEEMLTPDEVLEELNIGETTLYRWTNAGVLKPTIQIDKIRRFRRSDIEALKNGTPIQ